MRVTPSQAKTLKREIAGLDLTRYKVAAALDMDPSHFSRALKGEREVPTDFVQTALAVMKRLVAEKAEVA